MNRPTLLSYLADYPQRGGEIAYVHRRGPRTVRWSYARVASAAHATARELERRGIGKGERVILQGENCAEWVAAFWGCLLRGCIVVPLDRESASDFVYRVQEQVTARLLIADAKARARSRLQIPVLGL
ncbi:MAG: AMP-binding protein, partial [Acidobacteriota bacterium]|nr:AMP-binding protein [Acidobacteriota bacterium]